LVGIDGRGLTPPLPSNAKPEIQNPLGGLLMGKKSVLYGTTYLCGEFKGVVVYRLKVH
jgi:hypothetical protein